MKKIIYILKDIKRTINWWFVGAMFFVSNISYLFDFDIEKLLINDFVLFLIIIIAYLNSKTLREL